MLYTVRVYAGVQQTVHCSVQRCCDWKCVIALAFLCVNVECYMPCAWYMHTGPHNVHRNLKSALTWCKQSHRTQISVRYIQVVRHVRVCCSQQIWCETPMAECPCPEECALWASVRCIHGTLYGSFAVLPKHLNEVLETSQSGIPHLHRFLPTTQWSLWSFSFGNIWAVHWENHTWGLFLKSTLENHT